MKFKLISVIIIELSRKQPCNNKWYKKLLIHNICLKRKLKI